MTREQIVLLIGFCVSIAPFIGVPLAWKKGIIFALGLLVIYLGYTLQRRRDTSTTHDSYQEKNGELHQTQSPVTHEEPYED